jgi:hypothetical protein
VLSGSSTETANAKPSTRNGRSAITALPGSNGGYGGSGPAQLALAILAEHLGDDHAALNLYQAFKWACIAQILGANWSLSGEEIDNYLARLSEQQEATQPLADPFPF